MVSILCTLDRIKRKPLEFVDQHLIERVCHELGYQWRDGPLDPVNTVALFIQQIIQGNCSCQAVRHWGEEPFSGAAYCQARARLPLKVVSEIGRRVAQAAPEQAEARWRGHRVFHIDGSSFSMPDTPELQKHFGQSGRQKPGCGFPTAHLLVLFNANNGLILDAIASPLRTHDMSKAALTHAHLGAGDLLVGDVAFGTWGHIASLLRGQMHGLFPNHQHRIVDFRPHRRYRPPGKFKAADQGLPTSRFVRRLGRHDQLVEWLKPRNKPMWMSREQYAELPDSIIVREIRRMVRRKGFRPTTVTIVTTLLDAELYPADELVKLAQRRWDVETNLRHLKTTLKMDVLKCKSVDNVLKD
jgi:Transposase DDE domain